MARKKYLLRDLEHLLLRAHAELIVMLRLWDGLHPQSNLRWKIEQQMERTARSFFDAFGFPRLRSRAQARLRALSAQLAELLASTDAASWSKMPPLACGQRWEHETPRGPVYFTIGTPTFDDHERAGFSVFVCSSVEGLYGDFVTTEWLCHKLQCSNARLVAGPSSPWFGEHLTPMNEEPSHGR